MAARKVAVSPLTLKDQAITDSIDSGSSSGCDSSSGVAMAALIIGSHVNMRHMQQ